MLSDAFSDCWRASFHPSVAPVEVSFVRIQVSPPPTVASSCQRERLQVSRAWGFRRCVRSPISRSSRLVRSPSNAA